VKEEQARLAFFPSFFLFYYGDRISSVEEVEKEVMYLFFSFPPPSLSFSVFFSFLQSFPFLFISE